MTPRKTKARAKSKNGKKTTKLDTSKDFRSVVRLDARKKREFLAHLRRTTNVRGSCRAIGMSTPTVYKHRAADKAFARAWDEALEEAMDDLEQIMRERATVGREKPVWHKGEQVGSEFVPSDTLAIFLAKANRPEKYWPESRQASVVVHDNRTQIAGLSEGQLQALAVQALENKQKAIDAAGFSTFPENSTEPEPVGEFEDKPEESGE